MEGELISFFRGDACQCVPQVLDEVTQKHATLGRGGGFFTLFHVRIHLEDQSIQFLPILGEAPESFHSLLVKTDGSSGLGLENEQSPYGLLIAGLGELSSCHLNRGENGVIQKSQFHLVNVLPS